MRTAAAQQNYMMEELSRELIVLLIHDLSIDLSQAMDLYYNSDTFDGLSNPNTGLFYQSAGYVYDFLKNELKVGVFG